MSRVCQCTGLRPWSSWLTWALWLLRSRFQGRYIGPPSADALVSRVAAAASNLTAQTVENLVAFAEVGPCPLLALWWQVRVRCPATASLSLCVGWWQTMHIVETQNEAYGARLPHFPSFALDSAAACLASFPSEQPATLLRRLYPYDMLEAAAATSSSLSETVDMALEKFSLGRPSMERCVSHRLCGIPPPSACER